jgi:hypothetical protein
MKKTFFSVALALFMLGSCSGKDITVSRPPGSLTKVAPDVWDLGQVKTGKVVTGVFAFKNDADKTITVSSIQTSCGCTGSTIKEKTLAPAASTEVTVRFDSKGYRPGPVEQFLYINTDNADNPVIKYIIRVKVIE